MNSGIASKDRVGRTQLGPRTSIELAKKPSRRVSIPCGRKRASSGLTSATTLRHSSASGRLPSSDNRRCGDGVSGCRGRPRIEPLDGSQPPASQLRSKTRMSAGPPPIAPSGRGGDHRLSTRRIGRPRFARLRSGSPRWGGGKRSSGASCRPRTRVRGGSRPSESDRRGRAVDVGVIFPIRMRGRTGKKRRRRPSVA